MIKREDKLKAAIQ